MATPAKRLFRPPTRPSRQPDWTTSRPTYRPRQPNTTPLYPVVQHHIETFLAQAAESDPLGYGVAAWAPPHVVVVPGPSGQGFVAVDEAPRLPARMSVGRGARWAGIIGEEYLVEMEAEAVVA